MDPKSLPLRYLPPGTVKDLFSDYKHQGGLAGYKTFLVEWHARWESVLRFRTVSTHAECSDCFRLKNARHDAEAMIQ
eukprot:16442538-Heterocapsa_arctica.AAC.1